jgi:hypothetical protein
MNLYRNNITIGDIPQLDVVPSFFPKTGLVAYYKLDGNSNDSVGSNNGTDINVSYNASYGKIGQGASVTGNGKIATSSNVGISGQGARTIAGWFNCQTQPSGNERQTFFELGALSNNNWFCMALTGSNYSKKGQFSIYGVDLYTASTLTPLTSPGWHFVVIRYSGGALSPSTLKFSIDNVDYPFASYTGTPNTTNSKMTIGGRGLGGVNDWLFKGYFDEVGLWSRALTSDEITQLYNNGNGLTY